MLKLKRFDEGVWFDYQPGLRIRIKPISKWDMVHVRSRSKRKLIIQGADGPSSIVDDYDQGLFMLELFKICLLDWEGLSFDGKGKPDKEEAIRAIFEEEELRDFILKKGLMAFDSELTRLEEELKNSESSQSGPSSSKD